MAAPGIRGALTETRKPGDLDIYNLVRMSKLLGQATAAPEARMA